MPVLLHVCCAPCLIYPARVLRGRGEQFSCYFCNPNIHPYKEFRKRLDTFLAYTEAQGYERVVEPDYGLRDFLRAVVFNEDRRCRACYRMRLEKTAAKAAALGFDRFSSTLLYSRYQKHELIRQEAERAAPEAGPAFLYDDFRTGWQEGVDASIALNLYRQQYCGCIYSEQERFDNRLKKRLRKREKTDVQPPRTGHEQRE